MTTHNRNPNLTPNPLNGERACPRPRERSPSPRWGEGRGEVFWLLVLGASLVLGAWSLELRAASPPASAVPEAAPAANALGSWLISATAALSIVALGKQFTRKTPLEAEFLNKKEFSEFRDKVETNFESIRSRIDNSHETLANKLDTINDRLSDVSCLVARLDERTKVHAVHSPSMQSTESQIVNRKS